MLKNVTITVTEEVAHWARKKAAEDNTSVSKLVGAMLEKQMRLNDEYWCAYATWKKIAPVNGMNSAKRLSRDETHERR